MGAEGCPQRSKNQVDQMRLKAGKILKVRFQYASGTLNKDFTGFQLAAGRLQLAAGRLAGCCGGMGAEGCPQRSKNQIDQMRLKAP